MGRGHVGGEGNPTFLTGSQTDGDDGVVSQGGDDLAFIAYAIYLIVYQHTGIVEIQQTFVVLVGRMSRHREIQVAKRLIGHAHVLACAHRHHLLIRQGLGFFVFPLEDELAYLGQV